MASSPFLHPARAIHPVHAAVLGGVLPLFLGTLLADYAYWSSHEIQWSNFAAWLLIGAMVMSHGSGYGEVGTAVVIVVALVVLAAVAFWMLRVSKRLPIGRTAEAIAMLAPGAVGGAGGNGSGGGSTNGGNARVTVDAIADGGNRILVRMQPAPGYYLYRDRTSLKLEGSTGVLADKPRWPTACTPATPKAC